MTDKSGRGVSLKVPLCDSLLSFFQDVPPASHGPREVLQSDITQQPRRQRQLPVNTHRKGGPGTASNHNILGKASRKGTEGRLALAKCENHAGGSQQHHVQQSDRRRNRRAPFEPSLLMTTNMFDSRTDECFPRKNHQSENAPNSSRSQRRDQKPPADPKLDRGANVPRTHRNALSALENLPSERSNEDERNLMAPPPPRVRTANPERVVPVHGRPTQLQVSSLSCTAVPSEEGSQPTSKEAAANSTNHDSQRNGVTVGARRNRGAGHGHSGLQTLFDASYLMASTAAVPLFSNPPQHLPNAASLRSGAGETKIGTLPPSMSTLTTGVARRRGPTTQHPANQGVARNNRQPESGATLESVLATDQDDSAPISVKKGARMALKQNVRMSGPLRQTRTARRPASQGGAHPISSSHQEEVVHTTNDADNPSRRLELPPKSPMEALEKRMSRNATPPRQSLLHAQRMQLFLAPDVAQETGVPKSAKSQDRMLDCLMDDAGSASKQVQESSTPDGDSTDDAIEVARNASNEQSLGARGTLLPQPACEECNDVQMVEPTMNDEAASTGSSERPDAGPMSPLRDLDPEAQQRTETSILEAEKQPPQTSYFDYYNAYRQYPSIPQPDPSALSCLRPPARDKAPDAKDAWSDVTMSIATDKHVDCDAEVIIPSFIFLPALPSEADGVVDSLGDVGAQHEETCAGDDSISGQQNAPSNACEPSNATSRVVKTKQGRKRREKKVVGRAGKTAAKFQVSAIRTALKRSANLNSHPLKSPHKKATTGKTRPAIARSQDPEPLRRSCRTRTAPNRLGVIAVDDGCTLDDFDCDLLDCGSASTTKCGKVATGRLESANDVDANISQVPTTTAQGHERLMDAHENNELEPGTAEFKVTDCEPDASHPPLQHSFPLRRSTRVRVAPDRLRNDNRSIDSEESSGDESVPLAERVKAAATNMKLSNRAGTRPNEPAVQPSFPVEANDSSSRPQRQRLRPDRLGFDRKANSSEDWSQVDDSSSTSSQAKPSSSNHPARQAHDQPKGNAASKKTRVRGNFVRRPIPSFPPLHDHQDEEIDGWSSHLVRQLREAFAQVDPTSVSFWDDVAILMHGSDKTASECRDKWFSLVKTPKAAARVQPKTTNANPVARPSNAAEDDLFNSTPLRCESDSPSKELHHLIKQLPAEPNPPSVASEKCSVAIDDRPIATDVLVRPPAVKPGFKSYLQGMRRDLNRSKKEASTRRSKKAAVASKAKSLAIRETFQDDDLKLKVQLSPGGTLQINNVEADGDEEDDFWNLYEDEEVE